MEQTVQTSIAQQLNNNLPSYSELASHELLSRIIGLGMLLPSNREKIATAVNQMLQTMTGRPWFNGYNLDDDNAVVFDHAGNPYEINMEEFDALTKVMFCSYLQVQMTPEAYDLYLDFKGSDTKFFKILD